MNAAFLDACVLWPLPLADLLLRAAHAGLSRVHWSAQVQREWADALARRRPGLDPALIAARNAAMDEALPCARVDGHEGRIESLQLPDADDRHVLAAAIHAGAAVIVTYNLRDFPAAALKAHGLRAEHPDDFLCRLHDGAPQAFAAIARDIVAAWDAPPIVEVAFFERLARLRLTRTAQALRGAIRWPAA